jgi:hypothetical protein
MAGQISPTRSALLASKASLKTASGGADLLKRKRDALIGEFFALVKDALAAREQLSGVSKGAYTSLFGAKAWDSPEAVESLSLAGSSDYQIDMHRDQAAAHRRGDQEDLAPRERAGAGRDPRHPGRHPLHPLRARPARARGWLHAEEDQGQDRGQEQGSPTGAGRHEPRLGCGLRSAG